MKHACVPRFRPFRLPGTLTAIAIAALLTTMPASADEYANVNQLIRSSKLADAQARAERYLATNPRDPQMRFLQSVIQSQSGRTDDAIDTLTALTREYPELPEPFNNLAVLYAGRKDYDKARAALEAAIRNNPSYGTAHENLGDIYLRLAAQSYTLAQQRGAASAALQAKQSLLQSAFSPLAPAARGDSRRVPPTTPADSVEAPVRSGPAPSSR